MFVASLLIELKGLLISLQQADGLSLSRRLFMPTWIMSWSGFFLKIGLI